MKEKKEKELLEIGETIRRLRRSKDYSQEVLAEAVNVSPLTISRIENGTSAMNVLTLKRMAETLQVPVSEIVKTT